MKINEIKNNNPNNKIKHSTKIAAMTGSAIGVTTAVTLISRGHGVKIPSTLKHPNGLVNILKNIELKERCYSNCIFINCRRPCRWLNH